MNVSAVEKSTGKTNKVTITNEKGRLSKDDIDRMVRESEQYKVEDEKIKERIETRNDLENYIYSIRHALQEEKVKEKLSSDDTSKLDSVVADTLQWLEQNTEASKEEVKRKKNSVEATCNPIMAKVYQGAGASMPGEPSQPEQQGPKVEEVD